MAEHQRPAASGIPWPDPPDTTRIADLVEGPTPRQIEGYRRDGFLIVERFLDTAELESRFRPAPPRFMTDGRSTEALRMSEPTPNAARSSAT